MFVAFLAFWCSSKNNIKCFEPVLQCLFTVLCGSALLFVHILPLCTSVCLLVCCAHCLHDISVSVSLLLCVFMCTFAVMCHIILYHFGQKFEGCINHWLSVYVLLGCWFVQSIAPWKVKWGPQHRYKPKESSNNWQKLFFWGMCYKFLVKRR